MTGDSVQLVNDAAPYVVSALSAYGGAVLAKTKEEAANATVGIGRRLTRRIFGTRREGDPVPKVLADVIQDPSDPDYVGALRVAMRDALAADRDLADQVRAILATAGGTAVTASGERSVAVATNSGIIATGDGNTFR
jgi:hypothetical protein